MCAQPDVKLHKGNGYHERQTVGQEDLIHRKSSCFTMKRYKKMAWWRERQDDKRLSTCIQNIGWVIAGRGKNHIVIWNWVWFVPMWMNNPLGVMQIKWQIQEEEWHRLLCQNQMCPHFQSVSILSASWILQVQELLAGSGVFRASQGQREMNGRWQRDLLKVRECRKRLGKVFLPAHTHILYKLCRPSVRNFCSCWLFQTMEWSVESKLSNIKRFKKEFTIFQLTAVEMQKK